MFKILSSEILFHMKSCLIIKVVYNMFDSGKIYIVRSFWKIAGNQISAYAQVIYAHCSQSNENHRVRRRYVYTLIQFPSLNFSKTEND